MRCFALSAVWNSERLSSMCIYHRKRLVGPEDIMIVNILEPDTQYSHVFEVKLENIFTPHMDYETTKKQNIKIQNIW